MAERANLYARLHCSKNFLIKVAFINFPHISLAKANHLAKSNSNAVGSISLPHGGASSSIDHNIIIIFI